MSRPLHAMIARGIQSKSPLRRRRARAAAARLRLLVALACVWLASPACAATRLLDYLYIEANEGGSSGGHVALRFDAETFHFQQEAGSLIRLQRDDTPVFDVRYALLDNRPMHEQRIAVSDDTYERLHDSFTRLLFVQAAQFGQLQALADDVALLELWARRPATDTGAPRDGGSSAAAFAVPGAGYFVPDGFPARAPAEGASAAIVALRAAVAEQHGARFVADRIAPLRADLATWRPHAAPLPATPLTRDAYPAFAPTASSEYTELLTGLTALEVLERAPALRAGAYRVADELPPLDEHERVALGGFAATLSAELTALAASTRSDFGYPLLLGMARLAAMEASLASGRLVMLDAFSADAVAAPLPSAPERARYFAALTAELQPAVARTRHALFAEPDLHEADYAHLETAVNRLLEVAGAQRTHTPMRMERGLLAPRRPAWRTELVAPALPVPAVRDELLNARQAAAQYRARLAEIYGYNLLTRNCVSELFATIAATFAGDAGDDDTGERAMQRRLGGVVRTNGTLNFIPFVSADAVAHSYAAVGTRDRPSYRQQRRDRLLAEGPSWQVALRESNTLTSTIYHAAPQDSAFLFFTDDSVALRPLLGTANLLVGVADGMLGLATWPVDRGARLRAGWYGALFSLPELAFVNIRKGSMAWIEPDGLPNAGRWSAAVGRDTVDAER